MNEQPAIPTSGRDHSPRASRRAWAEPHVRLWWVTALVILAAGLYSAVNQVIDWRKSLWLINHGVPVMATVESVNDDKFLKGMKQPGDSSVLIHFTWQGEQRRAVGGFDGRLASQFIEVGETDQIFVDPNDPTHWTYRKQAPPIASEMYIPIIIVIASGVVGGISSMMQRRVLRWYRDGESACGRVISRLRSALAPRSWTVRCSLTDSEDKRVFTVYVPADIPVEPGDEVELIVPDGGRPLGAAWFQ